MILKASQRGGGQDLAVHLMRLDDNEHVELHELRGFASDDLQRGFQGSRSGQPRHELPPVSLFAEPKPAGAANGAGRDLRATRSSESKSGSG